MCDICFESSTYKINIEIYSIEDGLVTDHSKDNIVELCSMISYLNTSNCNWYKLQAVHYNNIILLSKIILIRDWI